MRNLKYLLLGPAFLLASAAGCEGGVVSVDTKPGADVALSSVVALRLTDDSADSIPAFVKAKVEAINTAADLNDDDTFPLTSTNKEIDGATDEDADSLRVADGLAADVVVKWLDPLTDADDANVPRLGANSDFTAFLGDGWDSDWTGGGSASPDGVAGSAPQFNGDGTKGWLWVNHKYVSDAIAGTSVAPTGQHLSFAKWLVSALYFSLDVVSNNAWIAGYVDTLIANVKKQVGGSWIRVVQGSNGWEIDKSAGNLRYDATSSTLSRITGKSYVLADGTTPAVAQDRADTGASLLDPGIVSGTLANGGGTVTPWGTILSAEGQWQQYYGDSEPWNGQNKLTGAGFNTLNANVAVPVAAVATSDFGKVSSAFNKHSIDVNGYLTEIEPGVSPSGSYNPESGSGHRKLGSFGRARWQNATFAVDSDWKLVDGKPVVIYATDDRQGGRIYKLVTTENYASGLTKAEIRALLDDAKVYVAEFADPAWDGSESDVSSGAAVKGPKRLLVATGYQIKYDTDLSASSGFTTATPSATDPGTGWWVELNVASTVVGPPASRKNPSGVATSAPAITGLTTDPTYTVGKALKSQVYNLISGFPKQADVLKALNTAATKLGVTELNRPEDIEYNPVDQRLYVAFNKHTVRNALDQKGAQYTSGTNQDLSAARTDKTGAIFTIAENDAANPATSVGPAAPFTFWSVWKGTATGATAAAPRYDVGNPTDLLIDKDGGVWFTTAGNFFLNTDSTTLATTAADGTNTPEGLYYLDLDGSHSTTKNHAFRIAKLPQDAKAKGLSISPDQKTFFFSVQAPGESFTVYPSTWPQAR